MWVQNTVSLTQIGWLIVSGGIAYLFKKMAFPESQYTSTLLENVQNVKSLFPHYFDTVANKNFAHHLWQRFLPLSITFFLLFIATLVKLFTKRIWLYLSAIGGCILFINTCFYTLGEESLLYFENLYQPVFFRSIVGFYFIQKQSRLRSRAVCCLESFGCSKMVCYRTPFSRAYCLAE
jgi:hypothetical protein